MQEMETLSEAIAHLRTEGYSEDFNLQHDSIIWTIGNKKMLHDEFVIDKFFRFEGNSDPADEATVYAISSNKHGIKGILVNGAGIYTDDMTNEMLETLKITK